MPCLALVIVSTFGVTPAFGQEIKFSELEGHSIAIEYVEGLSFNGREAVPYHWNDTIYVSTKGRIFHSSKQKSATRTSDYNRETVSELAGADFGQTGQFRWNENGFIREWVRTGVRLRYTVTLARSRSGFTCRATIERFGGRASASLIREKCRVMKGNIYG
jgi:hypothetical protein